MGDSGCRWSAYSGQCENIGCRQPGYDCQGDSSGCYCKPMSQTTPVGESNALPGTYGYCSRSQSDGACVLTRNPFDPNDGCDANCNYVSSPPYGCIWKDSENRMVDIGCSSNPGYGCITRSPGDVRCVSQGNQSQMQTSYANYLHSNHGNQTFFQWLLSLFH